MTPEELEIKAAEFADKTLSFIDDIADKIDTLLKEYNDDIRKIHNEYCDQKGENKERCFIEYRTLVKLGVQSELDQRIKAKKRDHASFHMPNMPWGGGHQTPN